jgi:hypothetical protein
MQPESLRAFPRESSVRDFRWIEIDARERKYGSAKASSEVGLAEIGAARNSVM